MNPWQVPCEFCLRRRNHHSARDASSWTGQIYTETQPDVEAETKLPWSRHRAASAQSFQPIENKDPN
jgi:hypothetical protein